MKILVLGGNRFVGLRLVQALSQSQHHEIHVLNRTGQVPYDGDLVLHKGDRRNLKHSYLQEPWDVIFDFCCYNQEEAKHSLEYFKGLVKRYIFISSQSVYDKGLANISESGFDPKAIDLQAMINTLANPGESYKEGKQRSEGEFFQHADFPVVAVRFPIICGTDDYTKRLQFHVERTLNNRTIFVPNLKAKLSLIQSHDAANFLYWAMTQKFTGPINVAAKLPISLEAIMSHIENTCKKKVLYATRADENNVSPYGIPDDWYMDVSKCESLGFQASPISEWLPGLVEWYASENNPRILH